MPVRSIVGAPGTVGGASGGYILGFNNLTTVPTAILAIDAQRTRIVFHNPGAVDVFVAQTTLQNTGSDVTFTPAPASPGGCYLVFGNGGWLTIDGECQKAWQAFTRTGTTGALTIAPSRIAS